MILLFYLINSVVIIIIMVIFYPDALTNLKQTHQAFKATPSEVLQSYDVLLFLD